MQTRTQKWVKNDLSEAPYRFHHATEAVLQPNGGCFTMQNSLRCSVTQAPLQPKRIFDFQHFTSMLIFHLYAQKKFLAQNF